MSGTPSSRAATTWWRPDRSSSARGRGRPVRGAALAGQGPSQLVDESQLHRIGQQRAWSRPARQGFGRREVARQLLQGHPPRGHASTLGAATDSHGDAVADELDRRRQWSRPWSEDPRNRWFEAVAARVGSPPGARRGMYWEGTLVNAIPVGSGQPTTGTTHGPLVGRPSRSRSCRLETDKRTRWMHTPCSAAGTG